MPLIATPDIIDLIPPGVVNHELTRQMLELFHNHPDQEWTIDELYTGLNRPARDFETRKTLFQLLATHDARMTPEHRFTGRKSKKTR